MMMKMASCEPSFRGRPSTVATTDKWGRTFPPHDRRMHGGTRIAITIAPHCARKGRVPMKFCRKSTIFAWNSQTQWQSLAVQSRTFKSQRFGGALQSQSQRLCSFDALRFISNISHPGRPDISGLELLLTTVLRVSGIFSEGGFLAECSELTACQKPMHPPAELIVQTIFLRIIRKVWVSIKFLSAKFGFTPPPEMRKNCTNQ